MRLGTQRYEPAAFSLRQRDPVPIVQEAGWALGLVWTVRKVSPPRGSDARTFQPVASRYTIYAIQATHNIVPQIIFKKCYNMKN